MFKRRNPRTWLHSARQMIYPDGGFRRATQYFIHRMRRLPDAPHRVARGVFAGTFINFPPLFGVQMIAAAMLAWVMRGNILAAVLCTFGSNPITTPFIAVACLELGHWMLGIQVPLTPRMIGQAFADAGYELWRNFLAMFSDAPTHWEGLANFWHTIYFPYLVGSIIPGLIFATAAYYLTTPLVHAYQKLRANKLRDSVEKRRRMKAAILEARLREEAAAKRKDDDGTPTP
jgi:uncharacterized protein (DUF2062 family)